MVIEEKNSSTNFIALASITRDYVASCCAIDEKSEVVCIGSDEGFINAFALSDQAANLTFECEGGINDIAWLNNKLIVTCHEDGSVVAWDHNRIDNWQDYSEYSDTAVVSVKSSPTHNLVLCTTDRGEVFIWEPSFSAHTQLGLFAQDKNAAVWIATGTQIIFIDEEGELGVFDVEIDSSSTNGIVKSLTVREKYQFKESIRLACSSTDGKLIACSDVNGTIYILNWGQDHESKKNIVENVIESQTEKIEAMTFSADDRFLYTLSRSGKVNLISTRSWTEIDSLNLNVSNHELTDCKMNSSGHIVATYTDAAINGKGLARVWKVESESVTDQAEIKYYRNAKIVLVGNSGVGKSGLGLVLAGQEFEATESTHGRHVWTYDEISHQADDGGFIETRETLLWDLAGQPGYRLVHQLHLDEVAVALMVFDASNEVDPIGGVRYWDRALSQAANANEKNPFPLKKILVPARVDRGAPGISKERRVKLLNDLDACGYVETSAKAGYGIEELREIISENIDWEALPKVHSSEFLISLKKFLLTKKSAESLIVRKKQLKQEFKGAVDKELLSDNFDNQFDVCVGRLEARGIVRRLSFGDLLLLKPELLDSYASALVNHAKGEPDGLGCILERLALDGTYRPLDENVVTGEDEKLLLFATIEDLISREIALREIGFDGPILVFPSEFTRDNPEKNREHTSEIIYEFEGPVTSVYATLAVRIAYSGIFNSKHYWRNGATYQAKSGGEFGIELTKLSEGSGEIGLFFSDDARPDVQEIFDGFVHRHIKKRAKSSTISRSVATRCSQCKTAITQTQVRKRLERNHTSIRCSVCDFEMALDPALESENKSNTNDVAAIEFNIMEEKEKEVVRTSAGGEMATPAFITWAGGENVTLAIVFTDIVDFTALGRRIGNERMRTVTKKHFARAQELVDQHDGYSIKKMGDSLMAAFRTSTSALNFLIEFNKFTGDDSIVIRSSAHIGLTRIEEEDVSGSMINFAARMLSHAKGKEICLSDRAKYDVDEEASAGHRNLVWKSTDADLKGFGPSTIWKVDTRKN